MQIKTFTGIALIAAAASLAACTTKPVTVGTPGSPGATTVQMPVLATPDLKLTNQVTASLASGLGTDAAGIDVRVEEGTVYLTGRVATAALRTKAIDLARGTANVQAVVATGLVVN